MRFDNSAIFNNNFDPSINWDITIISTFITAFKIEIPSTFPKLCPTLIPFVYEHHLVNDSSRTLNMWLLFSKPEHFAFLRSKNEPFPDRSSLVNELFLNSFWDDMTNSKSIKYLLEIGFPLPSSSRKIVSLVLLSFGKSHFSVIPKLIQQLPSDHSNVFQNFQINDDFVNDLKDFENN